MTTHPPTDPYRPTDDEQYVLSTIGRERLEELLLDHFKSNTSGATDELAPKSCRLCDRPGKRARTPPEWMYCASCHVMWHPKTPYATLPIEVVRSEYDKEIDTFANPHERTTITDTDVVSSKQSRKASNLSKGVRNILILFLLLLAVLVVLSL